MERPLNLGLVLDLAFAGFLAITDEEGNPLVRRGRPPGARYDDVAEWIHGSLTEAGGDASSLTWICVGVGPGSFTGIRIALAFVQGLAMPRAVPLYGFTSFAPLLLSLASEHPSVGKRLAILPANSGRFYAASSLEDPGALLTAEEVCRLGDLETLPDVPALTAAFDPLLPRFPRLHVVEERWEVQALVKHARSSGRDAFHPYYLQLSAPEAKLLESV